MRAMYYKIFFIILTWIWILCAQGSSAALTFGGAEIQVDDETRRKIDPAILQLAQDDRPANFFVWMTEKPNLTPAQNFRTKEEKGKFVFNTLMETAQRSQANVRAELDRQGLSYRWYYISNKILVKRGNRPLILSLAQRSDVLKLTANYPINIEPPSSSAVISTQAVVESNLNFIRADQVWNGFKISGQGTVLAGIDSGMDWQHPALINNYRGWNGSVANHNYNWWDATGKYRTAPSDGNGHGTHTSGTMAGDTKSGRVIGVSPDSKLIHCKFLDDEGSGWSDDASECFEFLLAPWDLSYTTPGTGNPRPDLSPDAVSNSWGGSGGSSYHVEDVEALIAAGIVVEVSAGNEGYFGCRSLGSPGDYKQVLSTGSVRHKNATHPGTTSEFSSRGPSTLYPNVYIPSVMAPGEDIVSSVPGGGYKAYNGTSMAGPHVTGLVGLLWSANPALRGNVSQTIQIIQDTAVPLKDQTGYRCGGDYNEGPNNDWGHGTIDAYAAVSAALKAMPRSQVEFTTATQIVIENVGAAKVTVKRSDSLSTTVSVEYFTQDGSATANVDYVSSVGTLTFAPNETQKDITVGIIDDKVIDGNKSFILGLRNVSNGQLGSQNKTEITITDNDLNTTFRAIGTGYNSSFAVTQDGKVWAWGNNKYGQLGDGTTTNRLVPVPISLIDNVIAIDGGSFHTLALKNDGTVWTWGDSYTAEYRKSPTQIKGIDDIIAIAAGSSHSLALKKDGTVWSWGWNSNGELGIGSTDASNPTQIAGLANITAIDAGSSHSMALSSNGTVWAWGNNDCSQIGDGTFNDRLSPYLIPDIKGKIISTAHLGSAVLAQDGKVWVWGTNGFSDSWCNWRPEDKSVPAKPRPVLLLGIATIATGDLSGLFGIKPDGKVAKWSFGSTSELSGLSNITMIRGEIHAIFASSDGKLFAVGDNESGQLGNGTTTDSSTPVRVLLGDTESPPSSPAHGVFITPDIWIDAEIQTVEKGSIHAGWKQGGDSYTERGDRVIWGYFYANPSDVSSWGSQDNPDLYVKAWYDVSGRIDVNFFHVSVPDIKVYSAKNNGETLGGTATTDSRYIRHSYNPNKTQNATVIDTRNATVISTKYPRGQLKDAALSEALIDTVEKGAISGKFLQGGSNKTARGDSVSWGYFYANPTDVSWGNLNNPEVFLKIWHDISGRIDVNFFHVSVPNIDVSSYLTDENKNNSSIYISTVTMDKRYSRHEYIPK